MENGDPRLLQEGLRLKVCIPIEFRAHGGGFYFLQAFENYLLANHHSITRAISDSYDLLFTNHWMVSRREVVKAFQYNPQVRIVQRIDGAAQDYGRNPEADQRQRTVNLLADLTIFQSEYCRYSTMKKFHVIINDGPVIYNPVDLELFNPVGPRRTFGPHRDLVACVTWSTNPMKGAASIYAVALENPEVAFILCGQYDDAPDLPNVYRLGVLERQELARVLRACTAMLTFSQNEACPNHVLEGLASGLPILYHDSGAMREVIGGCGLPVTVPTFAAQFAKMKSMADQLSKDARKRAETLFNPRDVFGRYAKFLFMVLDSPPKVSPIKRKLLSLASRIGFSHCLV